MRDSRPAAERCRTCRRWVRPVWEPPVYCAGRPLAGTGVWRSTLDGGRCEPCTERLGRARRSLLAKLEIDRRLQVLMHGPRPVREFTLRRFSVGARNRAAFYAATKFDPAKDNLYLWGPCGVGKTHLAYAIGRRAVESGQSAQFITLPGVVRRVRMREPEDEERQIGRLAVVDVLVLDDVGVGTDTAYSRQILQEVLDRRLYRDRGGLVVTAKYSLDQLAAKLADDSIPSRLAGMCAVAFVGGRDARALHRA